MLATIELNDLSKGNIYLHFGDVITLDPPNIIHRNLELRDFSNPMDLFRIKQVWKMKGLIKVPLCRNPGD